MNWQVLLVINLGFASIREYLSKRIADSIDPFVAFFQIMIFSVVWYYLIYITSFKNFPQIELTVAGSGIFIVLGFAAYLYAVKYSLSQSILFQSYSILITVLLAAVFMNEKRYFDLTTTMGQKIIGGGALAIVAIWFLLHPDRSKEEKLEWRWFFYILLAIIFFGIGSFFTIYYIQSRIPLEVLVQQSTVMVLLLFLINIFRRKKVLLPKKLMQLTFASSIVSTVAVLAFYQALTRIPVAKFFPLQQVSLVIITMFTGIIFFKETKFFSGKSLLGMVLGFIGIILLVTS